MPRPLRPLARDLVGLLAVLAAFAALDLALPGAGRAAPPPLALALPDGARELARAFDPAAARLDLYLAWPSAGAPPTEESVEAIVRAALEDERDRGRDARAVIPWVATPDGWTPLPALVPAPPPVPRRPWEGATSGATSGGTTPRALLPRTGGRRQGALSGKHIYVSAGHGFTWDPALGRWATQRDTTWGIVEDLVSAETVDQLLVTGLENAGATVWTVRERDMSPAMAVVDDADAEATGAWFASTAAGFADGLAPYAGDVNPFTAGGTQVVAATAGAPTATMTWPVRVAAAGDYGVYVSWSASPNRVRDAHFVVRHAGGESHFRVDEQHHGGTWFHLGRFYFEPGRGEVVLGNDTAEVPADRYVAADAVRVGGGMGDFARGDGAAIPSAPLSGRPRWEENARYHIQFAGAPNEVYAYTGDERSDDVGARSRYTAWQHEAGEDAVYVAWHTNAPSPARGTSTYVYGPNPPDGSYDFTGAAGSDTLAEALHGELVGAIRDRFDAGWQDRGIYSAYFGEINPRHNAEMPSVLVEVAFHSTEADAAWLAEPAFRAVAARAYVHGLIAWFADKDGVAAVMPPEAPRAVSVRGVTRDRVRVAWEAPESGGHGGGAATGYRVYRSVDGRAFDDGTDVAGTSVELDGAAPGAPVFVRVTATNAGGESFPSAVLGAGTACDGAATALVVMGFTRLDASLLPRDDLSGWRLGTVLRGRLADANRYDYVIEHAQALVAAGLPFDAVEAEAVTSETLTPYAVVDWLLGEESTADEALSTSEQAVLTGWLGAPGRTLLASGAELAWDLDARGSAADKAFLASLGAAYAADDAGTDALEGGLLVDDGTRGTYAVEYPDVLAPVGGAEVVLRYGDGQVAGTRLTLASGAVAIVLGAPLEALSPAAARSDLVARLLTHVSAPGTTCDDPIEPGPEAEPRVEADAEADARADTDPTGAEAATGAEAGRPLREVRATTRTLDDGCSGAPDAGLAGLLAALALALAGRQTRAGRSRRARRPARAQP